LSELGDYGVTRDIEDAIRAIARSEVASARPQPRYALVKAIDPDARRAQVQYNGDTTLVWVPYGSERPAYINQPVVIEGTDNDRRIAQIIGNTQADVDLAAVTQAAIGPIAWTNIPNLGTGITNTHLDTAKYRVIVEHGTKTVQLRGRLEISGSRTLIWTMPTDARPPINLPPLLVARDPSGGSTVVGIEAQANGQMIMSLVSQTAGANSGNTSSVTGATNPGDNGGKPGEHRHFIPSNGAGLISTDWTDWNGPHNHTLNPHLHSVPSVTAPAWISLNGTQYHI